MALDFPLQKPDRLKQAATTGHEGQLEVSVLERVAGITLLLFLCRELPVHFLQRVVDIGPVQVSASLCPGAEEPGHVHHHADQQKENQDQSQGQPGGPGGRREIPDSGLWQCWRATPPSHSALLPRTGAQGRGLQRPHSDCQGAK